MASTFQNTWQIALDAERELLKSLADKEPTFTAISHYLSESVSLPERAAAAA
ncbi:hypothetical protein P170DRAFT_433748 [Aspergillus steynii IBT 23096]|uniref:Uncharacterized protein n=1 Tax=Aspergillus steynii IBT 23096 TaxID=1392250 RepID=A0A2I2GG51_9EURO|nr:uncharacterized protein P170DRAFT_433748 [Aspergillus steynii IBT 23096]PLB51863.1 hypothetical protein P170DRAFT_433748 [Aspergillus steynii IBT 23096]